jgi:lipopolysaccharide export LptBFGC system permease protein LptF
VGAGLFLMDATILGPANRVAESLRGVMRGGTPVRPLQQPWMAGSDGTIYHVRGYDPLQRRFEGLDIFEFDDAARLVRRTVAASAVSATDGGSASWELANGWTRTFDAAGEPSGYTAFDRTRRELETAAYFTQEPPDARFMSYAQLRQHSARLRSSGLDAREHEVGAARKVAYPFVTMIMTLIAIPFAMTLGRSGTMAGIAAGIGLAIAYWGTINVSAALGAGGALAPLLAAWAPNLVFGAGAAYLLLTVRT